MEKFTALLEAISKFATWLQPLLDKTGRLTALFDKSAWLMMAPALIGLYYTDQSLAETLVQWTMFALALAGAVVVVSRVIFPQINIGELVDLAKGEQKSLPASIIIGALVLFVGLLFLGMVIWAKA